MRVGVFVCLFVCVGVYVFVSVCVFISVWVERVCMCIGSEDFCVFYFFIRSLKFIYFFINVY